jgi:hypothetical protein
VTAAAAAEEVVQLYVRDLVGDHATGGELKVSSAFARSLAK